MYLKKRSLNIVRQLLNLQNFITIEELALLADASKRTIRYDLDEIDSWLKEKSLPPLTRKQGKGVALAEEIKYYLALELERLNLKEYIFSSEERVYWILVNLLKSKPPLTINYIGEKICVSRGTVLEDIRKAKLWLNKRDINLIAKKGKGFYLEAKESCIRKAWTELLENYPKMPNKKIGGIGIREYFNDLDLAYIEECVSWAEKELTIIFEDRSYAALVIHLAIALKRIQVGRDIIMPREELEFLERTDEFRVAWRLALNLEKHYSLKIPLAEIGYITHHLIGSKRITQSGKEYDGEKYLQYEIWTQKLIEEVANYLGSYLERDKELFQGLLQHLQPTLYRLQNKMRLSNPLLEEIKEKYSEIFVAVKKSIHFLEQELGVDISDDEVAYLTMHFGAAKERISCTNNLPTKILLVCSSGIGTAQLLASNVKREFPQVEVIDIISYRSLREYSKFQVDYVISTIPLEELLVPWVQVCPTLPKKDREKLSRLFRKQECNLTTNQPGVEVEALLAIIKKYSVIKEPKALREELESLISKTRLSKEALKPVLKDVLQKDGIRLRVRVKDWEEAVRLGGGILLQSGCVEKSYIEAMVSTVKELGPYIVIAPGIAMPHSRPENGVNKIGMSLITLEEGVNFGHQNFDPVRIVISLCAIDHSSHLKALAQLTEFLSNEKVVEQLLETDEVELIVRLIEEYSKM